MITGLTMTAAVGMTLTALAYAPSPPVWLWVPALALCALLARMFQIGARKDARRLSRWSEPLERVR